MTQENENILKVLVSQGDKKAFAMLFQAFYPKVFGFLHSIIGSGSVAEDLSQDVFVKVWKKRASLAGIASFDNWLFTITKTTGLDYLKSAFRRKNSGNDIDAFTEHPDVAGADDNLMMAEKKQLFDARLSLLPERTRRIFIMSRYMGIPNSHIASALGISKRTVENHISIAVRELKKVV